MDRFLNFTRKDISQKFYKDSRPNLRFTKIMLILTFVIRCVAFCIIEFAFRPELFHQLWPRKLGVFAIFVVLIFALDRLERLFARIQNQEKFKRARLIVISIDSIAGGVILMYFLGLGIDTSYLGSSITQTFLVGMATAIYLLFLVFMLINWYHKVVVITVSLIYYSVQEYTGSTDYKILVGMMALNIFMMWALIYLKEKAARTMYLERTVEFENSKAWKKILDEYLEGVLILSKEGNCKFSNFSINKILKREENIGLSHLDIFKKIAFVGFHEHLSSRMLEKSSSKTQSSVLQRFGTKLKTLEGFDLNIIMMFILEEWKTDANLFATNQGELMQTLLILETVVLDEDYDSKKYFQVKISLTSFDQLPHLILMLTETTHLKTIASLQFQDQHKSKILASVTHELRTPLNGSLNFLQLALDDDRVPEDVKKRTLELSKRCNQLLLSLINDILDLSRMEANKFNLVIEKKDVIKTIQECIQIVEPQAHRKQLSIGMIMDSDLDPEFSTDHSRLKQILLNLLSNAIKFTVKGEVTVRLVKAFPSGLLTVSVEDTGVGISLLDQKMLFQEYAQLGDEKQRLMLNANGFGLGLMIANKIACALGVDNTGNVGISVESQVGKGSVFSFVLEDKTFAENQFLAHINSRTGKKEFPGVKPEPLLQLTMHSPSEGSFASIRGDLGEDSPLAKSKFFAPKLTKRDLGSANMDNNLDQSCISIGSEAKPGETEQYTIANQTSKSVREKNRPAGSKKVSRNVSAPITKTHCLCSKVLAVDDNTFNIMACENLFASMNIKIDTAFSGLSALELVKQKNTREKSSKCSHCLNKYQIIFLDLSMPVMDGYETAKELRTLMSNKIIPWCPIIACSAVTTTSENSQNIFEAGMDEVCSKPLTKEKVIWLFNKFHLFDLSQLTSSINLLVPIVA